MLQGGKGIPEKVYRLGGGEEIGGEDGHDSLNQGISNPPPTKLRIFIFPNYFRNTNR